MSEFIDIRNNDYADTDKESDKRLRPLNFNDFSGQKKVVDNLIVFVKAAVCVAESLDHVLFYTGPPD